MKIELTQGNKMHNDMEVAIKGKEIVQITSSANRVEISMDDGSSVTFYVEHANEVETGKAVDFYLARDVKQVIQTSGSGGL